MSLGPQNILHWDRTTYIQHSTHKVTDNSTTILKRPRGPSQWKDIVSNFCGENLLEIRDVFHQRDYIFIMSDMKTERP